MHPPLLRRPTRIFGTLRHRAALTTWTKAVATIAAATVFVVVLGSGDESAGSTDTASALGEACAVPEMVEGDVSVSVSLNETDDGHWLAPLCVNGRGPFPFIVDTAAGSSAIFPALQESLALKPVPGMSTDVQGASGNIRVDMFRLDTMHLGSAVLRNRMVPQVPMAADQTPNEDLFGILGADFLQRHVVDFDFPRARLRLHEDGADFEPGEDGLSLGYRAVHRTFILLDAVLDGVDLIAVLDTGARRSVVNAAFRKAAGIEADSPLLEPTDVVIGATPDSTESFRYPFGELRMQPLEWKQPPIQIADLPVFAVLGLGAKPAMILGVDLLDELRLVVDYPSSHLWLGRSVVRAGAEAGAGRADREQER